MTFLEKIQKEEAERQKELYRTAAAYYNLRGRLHTIALDLKDNEAKEAILNLLNSSILKSEGEKEE